MFVFAKNQSGLFIIENISIKSSEKELLNVESINYKSAEHFLGYEKFLFFIRKNLNCGRITSPLTLLQYFANIE